MSVDYRDCTPQYLPAWVAALPLSAWEAWVAQDAHGRLERVLLDPTSAWRTQGRMGDYKIKVACAFRAHGTSDWRYYVLKSSMDGREARVYSTVQARQCPVIPDIRKIWACADDGMAWVLMPYYCDEPDKATLAIRTIRAMACYHALFWDDQSLKAGLPWDESSIYPFTSPGALEISLQSLPALYHDAQQYGTLVGGTATQTT